MRIFGFLIIAVSLLIVILSAFFGLSLPSALKGLIDFASLICVLGPVLGGCLIAYGSDTYKGCGAIFKPTLSREEAEIAVDVYKLAVRISIGAGFIGVMFGLIAMLGAMGAGNGMDMGALTGGAAVALITALYGLVFAFTLFLPLQCYFQHQLGKDS
jgi:flagellar motor component MotA